MITSSILNSIMFRTLSTYPTALGTMHIDRKQGNYKITPYSQIFDNGDVIRIQFSSDTATVPTLKSYDYNDNTVIDTISGSLVSTRDGDAGTRYYFNYALTLGSSYQDKCTYLIVTQGSDSMTSEPVYTSDLSEDINDGRIKIYHYTNYDRVSSDLDGRFIDWEYIDTDDNLLYFYLQCIDVDMADKDNIDVIEGAENYNVAAASQFTGQIIKSDPIPDYLTRKIMSLTSVDFWSANEVQYTKDSSINVERFGGTTSFQIEINAIQPTALGINVDNLGYVTSSETTDMIITVKESGKIADFSTAIPDGYMLHTILVRHASTTSGNDATITAGLTSGGTEYIDSFGGIVEDDNKTYSYTPHDLPSFTAGSTLFIGITGLGVVLDFVINFDKAS